MIDGQKTQARKFWQEMIVYCLGLWKLDSYSIFKSVRKYGKMSQSAMKYRYSCLAYFPRYKGQFTY